MSLSALHQVSAMVCVAASVVMLVRAQHRATRIAHAVVLGCMVALAVSMDLTVVLACAAALATTAATAAASRRRADRECAVDVAACSGLVLLMAVPIVLSAHAPAPGATGLHAHVHAAIPGGVDHQLGLLLLAGLLVLGWARVRRADASAWVMMIAMGAMAAA